MKNNNFTKVVLLWLSICIMCILSCKTRRDTIDISDDKTENVENFNKYSDRYEDFIYTNDVLGITLTLDSEWTIKTAYEDMNDFQKQYMRFMSSDISEVLFIGYNDTKKIGIRMICEKLDISNRAYYRKLTTEHYNLVQEFAIQTITDGVKEELTNLVVLKYKFGTIINKNNEFIFDISLFQNGPYNFRLEMWAERRNVYEVEYKYIAEVINTLNIIELFDEDSENTDADQP